MNQSLQWKHLLMHPRGSQVLPHLGSSGTGLSLASIQTGVTLKHRGTVMKARVDEDTTCRSTGVKEKRVKIVV